jgi:hypothetical protein
VLSTLLQDSLHPSHHLLNVLLQTANKLGLSNKKKITTGLLYQGKMEANTGTKGLIYGALGSLALSQNLCT